MRVVVDEPLCQGHAQCVLAAPEVFELGDDDIAHVVPDQLPEELRPLLETAVGACPVQAISLIDDTGRKGANDE